MRFLAELLRTAVASAVAVLPVGLALRYGDPILFGFADVIGPLLEPWLGRENAFLTAGLLLYAPLGVLSVFLFVWVDRRLGGAPPP